MRASPTALGRAELVAALADLLAGLPSGTPAKVAISGLDDFHLPGHRGRSTREEWTPRSYYDGSYDYAAFRALVLDPLSPGGSRRCRLSLFSSFHDSFLPETWVEVEDNAVMLADGIFLLRPELRACWDYVIWIEIDEVTSLARARERDTAWVGDADVVERRYRQRSFPAYRLYVAETGGSANADAVIDNTNPASPTLTCNDQGANSA